MEDLLTNYKIKLLATTQMLNNLNLGDLLNAEKAETFIRLKTMVSLYGSFVDDIERAQEETKLNITSPHLPLADVMSSESNIIVCDNCGNDNVDDGKHKYNMERCRCCEHYL